MFSENNLEHLFLLKLENFFKISLPKHFREDLFLFLFSLKATIVFLFIFLFSHLLFLPVTPCIISREVREPQIFLLVNLKY